MISEPPPVPAWLRPATTGDRTVSRVDDALPTALLAIQFRTLPLDPAESSMIEPVAVTRSYRRAPRELYVVATTAIDVPVCAGIDRQQRGRQFPPTSAVDRSF